MVTKTTLKLYITVYNNVVSVLTLLNLTENKSYFIKSLFYFNKFVTIGVKCNKDIQVVQCLDNPCDTAQCPNIPDAICVLSTCGQCSAHFFDPSGDDITRNCRMY